MPYSLSLAEKKVLSPFLHLGYWVIPDLSRSVEVQADSYPSDALCGSANANAGILDASYGRFRPAQPL